MPVMSNWLLAKYPDIYLYAGLLSLEAHAQNQEGMQHWLTLLAAAFDGLNDSAFGAQISHGATRGASAFPV